MSGAGLLKCSESTESLVVQQACAAVQQGPHTTHTFQRCMQITGLLGVLAQQRAVASLQSAQSCWRQQMPSGSQDPPQPAIAWHHFTQQALPSNRAYSSGVSLHSELLRHQSSSPAVLGWLQPYLLRQQHSSRSACSPFSISSSCSSVRHMTTVGQLLRGARKGKPARRNATKVCRSISTQSAAVFCAAPACRTQAGAGVSSSTANSLQALYMAPLPGCRLVTVACRQYTMPCCT